jgi:hypothetical protein
MRCLNQEPKQANLEHHMHVQQNTRQKAHISVGNHSAKIAKEQAKQFDTDSRQSIPKNHSASLHKNSHSTSDCSESFTESPRVHRMSWTVGSH